MMTNGNFLSSVPENLKTSAIVSSLLVIPLVVLELINRYRLPEPFPFALFGFMWLLPLLFTLILVPLARNLRAGGSGKANYLGLVPRIVLLILIASIWITLLIDQIPCFLGVPNCD